MNPTANEVIEKMSEENAKLRLAEADNERWMREVLTDFRIPFDDHKIGRRLAFTRWMADRIKLPEESPEMSAVWLQVRQLDMTMRYGGPSEICGAIDAVESALFQLREIVTPKGEDEMITKNDDYIMCQCVECGWRDGFLLEALHGDQPVDGYCDVCKGERTFKRVKLETTLAYATRLATIMWEKHFKKDSPDWKPLPDLLGVLSQIDNMIAGMEWKDAESNGRGG